MHSGLRLIFFTKLYYWYFPFYTPGFSCAISQKLPLRVMNIAVCAGLFRGSSAEDNGNFITEILSSLARQMNVHRFFIIGRNADKNNHIFPSNVEIIKTGFPGNGKLLRKYWWEVTLPGSIKRIKADVLLSFEGMCSMSLSIPQVLIMAEGEKMNNRSFKKAKIIAVNSSWYKKECIKQFNPEEKKIEVVPFAVNEIYKPLTETGREKVKAKYSDDKEYFLCHGRKIQTETFINLLKSFSYFKKRQQSNMKLLILAKLDKQSLRSLTNYKYRNDITVIDDITFSEEAALTGSSYAVLISPDDLQPVFNSLKVLQSAVPVIASEDSPVKEMAGDAALYTGIKTERDIGEKMIRIYTDENLRDQLISKGKIVAANFTMQNMADGLWRCIRKAVK